MEAISIRAARLEDQGHLGPLLLQVYGPILEREAAISRAAGLPVPSVEDELMAADDFYFSSIELMDFCFFALAEEKRIGVAAVNPYVNELQYLLVLPEWRRRGIGRRLFEHAREAVAKRGGEILKVEIPLDPQFEAGRAFLTAMGFSLLKERGYYGRVVG